MENVSYIGTRWYKCDFHLHTSESKCFKEREIVTPEQWVQEAINKELDCVAVTDHNSGQYIDKIKEAAKNTSLTVFPGVEITCSDAKIHLLVLFDVDKTSQDVYDFLIKAGIESKDFAEQTAQTDMKLRDVAQLANERGAIVIPAHIDEFNGLSVAGNENIKRFLDLDFINAVQVVHSRLAVPNQDYSKAGYKEELKAYLKEYYGTEISDDKIKDWRQAIVLAAESNKAILTFSDNPHANGESKHGLWGMGIKYTWIKMEQKPSLESLRQALLLPQFRIKNIFECPINEKPYIHPEQWIESITITNTEITDLEEPLYIEFSPQMNTIIGGRGSGKSSILRFLRGVFPKKVAELSATGLESIEKDFTEFFSLYDKRKDKGVLSAGTVIELVFHRKGEKLKIVFKQIAKNNHSIDVYRYSSLKLDYELIEEDGFIDLLTLDIFSQKQIYDIGTKTNSLRVRIDEQVSEILDIKEKLKEKKREFASQSLLIRQIEEKISGKQSLLTQIKDIENRIETFNKSGVNELIKTEGQFSKEKSILKQYLQELNSQEANLQSVINGISVDEIDLANISNTYKDEIKELAQKAKTSIDGIKNELESSLTKYKKISTDFNNSIINSTWNAEKKKSSDVFLAKKEDLAGQGITDLNEIEREIKTLTSKKEELVKINKEEEKLKTENDKKKALKRKFILIRKSLSESRRNFLKSILEGSNVKAQVGQFRDFDQFEKRFREIIASESGYEDDIKELKELWHSGNPERNNERLFEWFAQMQDGTYTGTLGRRFINKISELNGEQMDDLDLLFPEDQIIIQYKTTKSKEFKSISNASPGQKTAAILTLLLSHGNDPLILDQPEDDLDNYLIYDLVVEQLRRSKERRQVIVVTHNANIPVNGDSEHIVVMDSESRQIKPKEFGTIENQIIKNEICKVMEGGTDAFEMRAKRYNGLNNLI
jgi:energy-coupling factor transporter ATP-binding protein EcfA2